jgi:hypothetical protein
MSHHDKSLKFAASVAPYEQGSEYLELGLDNSRRPGEQAGVNPSELLVTNHKDYKVNVYEVEDM